MRPPRSEKSAKAVLANRSAGAGRLRNPTKPGRQAKREGPNGRKSEARVRLGKHRRQKSTQVELPLEDRGEAPTAERSGEARPGTHENGRSGNHCLMEKVVERSNV